MDEIPSEQQTAFLSWRDIRGNFQHEFLLNLHHRCELLMRQAKTGKAARPLLDSSGTAPGFNNGTVFCIQAGVSLKHYIDASVRFNPPPSKPTFGIAPSLSTFFILAKMLHRCFQEMRRNVAEVVPFSSIWVKVSVAPLGWTPCAIISFLLSFSTADFQWNCF